MKQYIEEVKSFLKNKYYVIGFLLLAFIAFGFAMMNPTISIDDLEDDRYVGPGRNMLASGRFGIWFWSVVQGRWENAFFTDVLSLLLLFVALINFCILFRRVSCGRIGTDALLVFSFMVLTYPLVIEIWEYTGANAHISGSYLMTSGALLLIWEQIHHGNWRRPWRLIPAVVMVTLVCSGYESVVAVYIFLVCAILALQVVYGSEKEKKLPEVIRQAAVYAGMLAAGVVFRVLIHKLTLVVLNMPPVQNGATPFFWGKEPVKDILVHLVTRWGYLYVLKAIVYLPLLILLVCGVAYLIGWIVCCKKYGAVLLLPGAGMLVSLVIISLVQGNASPYRTCQVFAFFCAFVAMMAVHMLPRSSGKKVWIRTVAVVLFGCLFLHQASYINYFLELNHRRSEQERFTVQQIGMDLDRMEDPEKPVIFVGDYDVAPAIVEAASVPKDSMYWRLYKKACEKTCELAGVDVRNLNLLSRKIPGTIVNSVLQWSMTAFGSQESMLKLFRHYGFDYVPADYGAVFEEATAYAKQTDMPYYPANGYIEDVGEYVIVHLQ